MQSGAWMSRATLLATFGIAHLVMMGTESCQSVDADGDGWGVKDGDCNDWDASINPGAAEVCDGYDNNCDFQIDDGVLITFYGDADGDGFGNDAFQTAACAMPAGYADVGGDCDDADAGINPAAGEACNGIDDNCDGTVDEGVELTFYADADGDGYGDASTMVMGCEAPAGYVLDSADCDDLEAGTNPGASEVCNGVDDNCSGEVDEGVLSTFFADADGDGYGDASSSIEACEAPEGYTADATDCNDTDSAVFPGGVEVCNWVDDDCDGEVDEEVQSTFYQDADGDGFGNAAATTLSCSNPAGFVADATDCDDANGAVNPAAAEACNAVDDDCDGEIDEGVMTTFYQDADGDGFGNDSASMLACAAPAGYMAVGGDCADGDATIFPGATEVCNAIDEDCDGVADDGLDSDNDGTADCFDFEECDRLDNDGDSLVDEDGVCETCVDGVPARCLTLWQAHARGEIRIQSTSSSVQVNVTNLSNYNLCLSDQILYTSPTTQTMYFDRSVTGAETQVAPGKSFSFYYGSWTTANGYYQPYLGLPAWWCVESIQQAASNGYFSYYGEEVPDDIAVYTNSQTDVDADGKEDHVDWAGSYGVQSNYNIWNYQTGHAVLTVGKTAHSNGPEIGVILTARNIGYQDGSGVVTDTTPYGYSFVNAFPEPASVTTNIDGTSTLTWDVFVTGTGGHVDANSTVISYTVSKIRPTDAPYVELAPATVDFFDGDFDVTNYSVPAAVYNLDVDGDGSSSCNSIQMGD